MLEMSAEDFSNLLIEIVAIHQMKRLKKLFSESERRYHKIQVQVKKLQTQANILPPSETLKYTSP